MNVTVRPIERTDAFALAALRIQEDRQQGCEARPGFLREYADALLQEWDHRRGWIAELDDGSPVGCALVMRVRTLPSLSREGRAEGWYLEHVFVVPGHRGTGIGRRLRAAVQDAARDTGIVLGSSHA